jgi:AcrR family transcriptional regulator
MMGQAMPRKRREDVIEFTREKILEAARQIMAQQGSAALSLREIARSVEMTAPAIYYYFASLDDLITALVLEAFNAMADALETARDTVLAEGGSPIQVLFAVCLAYRAWAVEHLTDFELIYGTPIPGYHAPEASTSAAASRSGEVFRQLILAVLQSGDMRPIPPYDSVPPAIQTHLRNTYSPDLDEAMMLSIYLTAVGWTQLHGIIMLEVFEHVQSMVGNVEDFYRDQVIHMMASFGIPPDKLSL